MKKKAYMFIVDAIISLFVLSLGIFLLVSSTSRPTSQQVQFLSQDLLNVMSKNEIVSISNDFSGPNGPLVQGKFIGNIHNTILEQVGAFYSNYSVGNNCEEGKYNYLSETNLNLVKSGTTENVCQKTDNICGEDEDPFVDGCCNPGDEYCKCCLNISQEFTKNIFTHLVPRHSVEIKIDGVVVYQDIKKPKDKATVLLPARTIVHGENGGKFYGPYTAEVLVWQ